ncbi:T9SS type A sorting domain-containing protein [bacterium]|nr:T9SS type A sorting domain-containing protein [bacterium]
MKALRPFLGIALLLLLATTLQAQLSTRTSAYGTKPGYIDDATLIVEPHGAYVQQTLILTYGDHGQFGNSPEVEIDHRFRLPQKAVVNDLWLWISNICVRGRIMSTWSARAVYDSIVQSHRDPAFLAKEGNIFELHVYPLTSGSTRQLKLMFITPTLWMGKSAAAELPLKMLMDNNADLKPLNIMFKVADKVWGEPTITELPMQSFGAWTDSAGYSYKTMKLVDISELTGLTLGFSMEFPGGYNFGAVSPPYDGTYFQFGFDPGALFNLTVDSTAKRLLVGLDLSGGHCKNFTTLLPSVKQLLHYAAKPQDSIQLLVAGAHRVQPVGSGWMPGHEDSIDVLIGSFANSDWGQEIRAEVIPHILYCDEHAVTCWQFPGLDNYATHSEYENLHTALQNFRSADVIAAYEQGSEAAGNTAEHLEEIIVRLDSFFVQGGRFLTYFDYNRVKPERLGKHYIPGLSIERIPEENLLLHSNRQGNIGKFFPQTFLHYNFNYLTYTPDTSVVIEVADAQGRPYVISKKIANGLLIISALWEFRDDAAQKTAINVPLLGLNSFSGEQLLTALLDSVRVTYNRDTFDEAIVLSNTDTLFEKQDAQAWTALYAARYLGAVPVIHTVNLLDGNLYRPASLFDNMVEYLGSGYLLKTVADVFGGEHYKLDTDPWISIISSRNRYAYPVMDSLSVAVTVDDGAGQLHQGMEVNPVPGDGNKPRFFIGSTTSASTLTFDVHARFQGSANMQTVKVSVDVPLDTTLMDRIIPAMLANENLNTLFRTAPEDTAAIVNLAMKYRLLCDYTAFLVLDADTIKYKDDPDDPGTKDAPPLPASPTLDSLTMSVYPNPFSGSATISVSAPKPARVRVAVFDMQGRRVRSITWDEEVSGTKSFTWDGTDDAGRRLVAGTYFICLTAREIAGPGTRMIVRLVALRD